MEASSPGAADDSGLRGQWECEWEEVVRAKDEQISLLKASVSASLRVWVPETT